MNYQKNIVKFGKKLKIVSKKFDSEPVYNEKDLKAKIKSFNGKVAVKESMNFYQGDAASDILA